LSCSAKATENVRTGSLMSSLISATFVDESTPPDRKTPNGTSLIIRLAIEPRSSSSTRSWSSDSPIASSSAVGGPSIGDQ
jgi:hypothetical protein